MRHESQFQSLSGNASQPISSLIQGPNVSNSYRPIAERSQYVESSEFAKKDAVGKLDDLIGGFQKHE
jgi:hypothetical protein